MIRVFLASFLFFPSLALANWENGKLEMQEISKGVFLHTSYKKIPRYGYFPSNGLVVIDGKDAYIIDTPWLEKDTKALVDWVSNSGYSLKASLSTHSHDDRSSGISYLNNLKITTYASSLTNRLLESAGMEKSRVSFEGSEFSLIGGVIEAYYPGAGHTSDNLVVWLPRSKILFGGCLTRSLVSKNLGNIADALIIDWPTTMQNIIVKYQGINIVIPGHGASGGRELLTHTLELARQANSIK